MDQQAIITLAFAVFALALKPNMAKYSVLMNEDGGMVDDLIVTKLTDNKYFAVVNGACKDKDIKWMQSHMPQNVMMVHHENRALIALQGPQSENVSVSYTHLTLPTILLV